MSLANCPSLKFSIEVTFYSLTIYRTFTFNLRKMAKEEKDKILKELFAIDDYNEKFKYLIQKGKAQLPLAEEFKIDTYRIEGCLSQLWLHPTFKDGKIYLKSDSDAAIPKGIAAILTEIFSGTTPDEALSIDPAFLKEDGIE